MNIDNHWEHDSRFAVNACAENSFELRHEKVFAFQTNSDSAVTQERIFLLVNLNVWQRFVAANIHCANDAEIAVAFFDSRFVFFELIFFFRHVGFAHENKFRTEKSNALRSETVRRVNVGRRTDICNKIDFNAVDGFCRQFFQFGVMGFESFLLFDFFVVTLAFFFARTN